ncbi:MAG: hypothetical protein ACLT0X_02095 [Collinsella sp.]
MSENEEIMNETENETMAAEVEAVETVETEAAEVEAADEVSAEEEAEVVEAAVDYDDEELMDKMQKAARLLRSRRFAISKEEEAKAERMANIERAIKLLDLKPKMEQKEMSDLLGMRLRELDGLMAEAEAADLVGRIDDAEGDMRKIVVFAAEDAAEGLVELANKKEKLLPELSYEEATELMAALDKVIAPLVAMGLDEDRGPRGGRDDRGGRGGDRGGRGGFGDRGGRGGDRAVAVAIAAAVAALVTVAATAAVAAALAATVVAMATAAATVAALAATVVTTVAVAVATVAAAMAAASAATVFSWVTRFYQTA